MNDSSNRPQTNTESYLSPDSQHAKAMTPAFTLESFMDYIVGKSTYNFELTDYFGLHNADIESYGREFETVLLRAAGDDDLSFTKGMFTRNDKEQLKKILDIISHSLQESVYSIQANSQSTVTECISSGNTNSLTETLTPLEFDDVTEVELEVELSSPS